MMNYPWEAQNNMSGPGTAGWMLNSQQAISAPQQHQFTGTYLGTGGFSSPIAQNSWQQYLDNAYQGIAPSRLSSLNQMVNTGGISDNNLNRAIWEDAMWGGSSQDLNPMARNQALNAPTGGIYGQFLGGQQNANQAMERAIPGYVAPTPTNLGISGLSGPYESVGDGIARSEAMGVPWLPMAQAAQFDADLTNARIEQGDIPLNTGPGFAGGLLALAGLGLGMPALGMFGGASGSIAANTPLGAVISAIPGNKLLSFLHP